MSSPGMEILSSNASDESDSSDSSMDIDESPSLPKSNGSKRKSETEASNESTPRKLNKSLQDSETTSNNSSLNDTSSSATQHVPGDKNDHQFEIPEKDKMIHGIRRICVASVNKELSERAEGKELEIIEQIMEKVNERLKNRPSYVRVEETPKKKKGQLQENGMQENRIDPPEKINGFGIAFYNQKLTTANSFFSVYNRGSEDDKTNKNNHTIVFFYNKGEIYASTSEYAWQPIQLYTDPDFPIKIANRLLNTNGPIKETNQNLAGINRQTTQCKKSEDGQNPYQALTIRKEFTADFRANCSIYGLNLNCFKKGRKDDEEIKDSIKVECGKAFVRIQTDLTNHELTSILNHYTKILNKEATFVHGSTTEEVSTEVYDKPLDDVPAEMQIVLDDQLYEIIQKAMQNNCMSELMNFDLCHKHINDYTIASQIYLHGGNNSLNLNPKVKFSEIIVEIMKGAVQTSSSNERSTFGTVNFAAKALSKETFKKEFQKYKISYKAKATKKWLENILNYVQGDLIYKEKVYWRYNSKWYQLKSMLRLNKQFQSTLMKHLLTGEEKKLLQLTEIWPRKEENCKKSLEDEVKDYFKLFTSKQNDPNEDTFHIYDLKNLKFIFNDELRLDSAANMYTILKIRKNGMIVFYYVQNGFSAIRDVSVEILKTLNDMFSVVQGESNNRKLNAMRLDYNKYFEKIYSQYLIGTGKSSSNKTFPTFSEFKETLPTSHFIFALVDPQEEFQSGKLERERNLRTEINLKDVETFLTNNISSTDFNIPQLKADLMNFLQNNTEDELNIPEAAAAAIIAELTSNGFIKGNVVTNQLLLSTEKEFAEKCFKDFKILQNSLFAYIKKYYHSAYRSILPKLELTQIQYVFTQFPMQFKICEISVE